MCTLNDQYLLPYVFFPAGFPFSNGRYGDGGRISQAAYLPAIFFHHLLYLFHTQSSMVYLSSNQYDDVKIDIQFKNSGTMQADDQNSLRLRRQRTTYFLTCGPFDSIDLLKRKLLLFHKGIEMTDIRLYYGNKVKKEVSSYSTISQIFMTKASPIMPSSISNQKRETPENGKTSQKSEYDDIFCHQKQVNIHLINITTANICFEVCPNIAWFPQICCMLQVYVQQIVECACLNGCFEDKQLIKLQQMMRQASIDPSSEPIASNRHLQHKQPPNLPTSQLHLLSKNYQEKQWIAAFIDGQFYMADPAAIAKLQQIDGQIQKEKNRLTRFEIENLSFNNSFLSAQPQNEANVSNISHTNTVFDPNRQIDKMEQVRKELEKEEEQYREKIKLMERQRNDLTNHMKKMQKSSQNSVIKKQKIVETPQKIENVNKSMAKRSKQIVNRSNSKTPVDNKQPNRYNQQEQSPQPLTNHKKQMLNKSIQWSIIQQPQNQPIKQTSQIIHKEEHVEMPQVMTCSDTLPNSQKIQPQVKGRKLNSGFIYTINHKKMKTFIIHPIPKREKSEIKNMAQSFNKSSTLVKPSSIENQPSSNSEDITKEQINKIHNTIQQLQSKLKQIQQRQTKQSKVRPSQPELINQIQPTIEEPSKKVNTHMPLKQAQSIPQQMIVKELLSPFRLKLQSSILQINMLEDKKKEEEGYYNQKNRLSQEIDRLKGIIRGMQIDKIKANDTPQIHNYPIEKPIYRQGISNRKIMQIQDDLQHERTFQSRNKAFPSNSRLLDAGKIIHVIDSPQRSRAYLSNQRQMDYNSSPTHQPKSKRKHPSHKFIESSKVIESSQFSKVPQNRYNDNSRLQQSDRDNPEDVNMLLDHAQDLQVPQLPSRPTIKMAQEELLHLAKQTYKILSIAILENQEISVKKYKNCIFFSISNHPHHNILWHFSGKFYFGGWKTNKNGEGQKDGEGLQISPHKHVYKGQFLNGKKNGTGAIKLQNGSIYDGQWAQGIKNGRGIYFDAVAKTIYNGQWRNNKKQGQGLLKISQKQYYEGTFVKSIKEGYGEELFPNGDKYKGEYANGKFQGKGKYNWANGSSYQGQFVEGAREGQGSWKSALKNGDTYIGAYKNDKKNGYGRYIWANGCIYEGQFAKDVKNGNGRITYQDGKQMKGVWKDGQLAKDQQEKGQHEEKPLQKAARMIPANFMVPSKRTSKN